MTTMRPHTDQPRGSKKVHRSLENLDEYNIEPPLLTSPRSLEACLRQGIEPEELVFRYFDSFFEQGVAEDLQEIRWKHYEKKRLEKLAQVRGGPARSHPLRSPDPPAPCSLPFAP